LGFKDEILVLSGKSARKIITKTRNKKRAAQALAPRERESLFFFNFVFSFFRAFVIN
jgi:hypothetical protein